MVIFLITKDGRLSAKGMPHLVIMLATQANLGATLRQIAVCLPNWGAGFQPAAAACCRYSKHSAAAAGYKPAPQLGR